MFICLLELFRLVIVAKQTFRRRSSTR